MLFMTCAAFVKLCACVHVFRPWPVRVEVLGVCVAGVAGFIAAVLERGLGLPTGLGARIVRFELYEPTLGALQDTAAQQDGRAPEAPARAALAGSRSGVRVLFRKRFE